MFKFIVRIWRLIVAVDRAEHDRPYCRNNIRHAYDARTADFDKIKVK